jgi:hypothetical protein
VKPLHAAFKRLNRCKCCQSKHTKRTGLNNGKSSALGVHVKLIDAAIEDVAKLHAQIASARKALTEIAALAHRWKWQFDLSEDQKLNGAQTRNLITQGFDSLHRLGDQALKSRDSLTDPEQK